MLFKRKREIDPWELFKERLVKTIDTDFEIIHKIIVEDNLVKCISSNISRIPVSFFAAFEGDDFKADITVESDRSSEPASIVITADFSSKKSRKPEKKIITTVESPREFISEKLGIKNESAIAIVDSVIQEHKDHFESVFDIAKYPYELIYHKKHNQIIIRLTFPGTVRIHKNERFGYAVPTWLEYNKKNNIFTIISIVSDCL